MSLFAIAQDICHGRITALPSPAAPKPEPVCSWCVGPQTVLEGEPLSHSMCGRHQEELRAEYRASRAQREARA